MNVLTRTSFIGIISVGMCFVIISGGIDLSVGSMVALIAGSMILIMNSLIAVVASPVWVIVLGMVFALVFGARSEEHTSELQSLMRSSYAVFCLKKKKTPKY